MSGKPVVSPSSLPGRPHPGRSAIRRLPAAVLLLLLGGCCSIPEISAAKAAEFSETFTQYAEAVERMEGYWADGLTTEEGQKVLEGLGAIRENLRADASNVKTEAMTKRLEGLGAALSSVPIGPVKVLGGLLALGVGIYAFAGRKKKQPLPS